MTPVAGLVLALVDDLVFASRIRVEVEQAGGTCQRFSTSQALLDAMRVERPALVIVDLEGMGFDGVQALRDLAESPDADGVPRIAYGSHVHAVTLEAAASAGATAWPRSRFVRELPERVRAALA